MTGETSINRRNVGFVENCHHKVQPRNLNPATVGLVIQVAGEDTPVWG